VSLSVEQAAVTASVDHHNLVLALPGAGKTHTMISFISNLVQNPDNKVIALTFTKAAASEMQARVGKLVRGKKRKQVFVSTFHSLIWSQTKKHPDFSGRKLLTGPSAKRVTNFIFEEYRILLCAAEEISVEVEETHDKQGKAYDEPKKKNKKIKYITLCNLLLNEFRVTPFHDAIDFDFVNHFPKGIDHFYTYYLNKLAALKYWPMDIMCVEITKALLVGDIEPIKCTQIIVDEFQDTDLVQYSWVKCHGLGGAKITCVGDDDQSIYSFRGALGVSGMRMFQDDFKVKFHTLSICFRCGSEILNSAGAVVALNKDRIEKVMNSGTVSEGEVFFHGVKSSEEEAEGIFDMINDHEGRSVAILARTNGELDFLELYLESKFEMDCNRLNSTSILGSDSLKVLLHFFCSIIQLNNQNHLIPSLVYLRESQDKIIELNRSLDGLGFGHCNVDEWSLLPISVEFHKKCQQYWHLSTCTDEDTIRTFIDDVFTTLWNNLSKGIQGFKAVFIDILIGSRGSRLMDKLQIIEDLTNQKNKKNENSDLPVLTTFHGAKGLEWDVVWLMGLGKENIPHKMPGVIMDDAVVEEERRLLYVAMTRAKTKLYLSWLDEPAKFLEQAFEPEDLI
jgi:DNA helicase-2/ATP-dependent DNA helicase PcrA